MKGNGTDGAVRSVMVCLLPFGWWDCACPRSAMTTSLVPVEEFATLLPRLSVFPELHSIQPIVKLVVDKKDRGTKTVLYRYSEDEGRDFYLAFKYQDYSVLFLVGNATVTEHRFYRDAIRALFPLVVDRLRTLNVLESVLPKAACDELLELFRVHDMFPYLPLNETTNCFFIEDEAALLATDITPPEGFEVRSLDPSHAGLMMSVLLHAQPGDDLQAAVRLAEFPSIGVFEKASGRLAAFEYNDGIGCIAHQYVFPEFRQRGLGRIVEVGICQRNRQILDIMPVKHVSLRRHRVQRLTAKLGLWSCMHDRDEPGEPMSIVCWSLHSNRPMKTIEIFDN